MKNLLRLFIAGFFCLYAVHSDAVIRSYTPPAPITANRMVMHPAIHFHLTPHAKSEKKAFRQKLKESAKGIAKGVGIALLVILALSVLLGIIALLYVILSPK